MAAQSVQGPTCSEQNQFMIFLEDAQAIQSSSTSPMPMQQQHQNSLRSTLLKGQVPLPPAVHSIQTGWLLEVRGC